MTNRSKSTRGNAHARRLIVAGLCAVLAALAAGVVLLAGVGFAIDAGYGRAPLIRYVEARTGRRIEAATLEMHLLSWRPSLTAERVSIGNPPWTAPGVMAEIGRLSVAMRLPGFGGPLVLESVTLEHATLHLTRDAAGLANWQWHDPRRGGRRGLPIIRSLSVQDARVTLDDDRRHLLFDGVMSAGAAASNDGSQPLRIAGSGRLNGRDASVELDGEPLANTRQDQPYHFSFVLQSSASRVTGSGVLPQPFHFDMMDGTFEASGEDLHDLYYSTGVTLIHTGRYRLSGQFEHRGRLTRFIDLAAISGQSDLRGSLFIDSSGPRSKLDGTFRSELLRTADLAAATRERESGTTAQARLSDAPLDPRGMRRSDGVFHYRARRVEFGRIALDALAVQVTIDHGVITAAPASAALLGGTLGARLRLDASQALARAATDLEFNHIELAQIARPGQDPFLEGPLDVRIALEGRGQSLHQIASAASGSVTLTLPHGAIRAALAELAGTDLRGVGLLLTDPREKTPIRCAIAKFAAQQGILRTESLVIDTEPVLITGAGQARLDSETLDLMLQGEPKSLRVLRVHGALHVQGPFDHPSVKLEARRLTLIDPGKARDADCAALLAGSSDPHLSRAAALDR